MQLNKTKVENVKMREYITQLEGQLHDNKLETMKTKLHTDELMKQVKKSHGSMVDHFNQLKESYKEKLLA